MISVILTLVDYLNQSFMDSSIIYKFQQLSGIGLSPPPDTILLIGK
jgi:hypothetical protein